MRPTFANDGGGDVRARASFLVYEQAGCKKQWRKEELRRAADEKSAVRASNILYASLGGWNGGREGPEDR